MSYELKKDNVYQLEVEKSKFISYAFFVKNPAEVQYFLKKLEKEHQKARHICYSYVINNQIKMSDDGEPSGTAGKPIYNSIIMHKMNNCLVAVVRYFGGTLLGSGRLLRTYSESASRVLNSAEKVELINEFLFKVELTYDIYDKFTSFLKFKYLTIIKKYFNDNIVIEFFSKDDIEEEILNQFFGKINILEKCIVEHRKE